MKIRTSLVHLTTIAAVLAHGACAQVDPPQARILNVDLDPQSVTVLHLRTGYVSSVRLPEPVNAVVLGDPGAFKAEHSEAEPHLVFFKPSSPKLAKTNALITTRTGRAISLSLVSEGNSDRDARVDYILEYQRPRSSLIEPTHSSFLIEETKGLASEDLPSTNPLTKVKDEQQKFVTQPLAAVPHWEGSQLRVGVGRIQEHDQEMTVAFSIQNSSSRTIELLPPQIQLAGTSKNKHGKTIKAEPVAIKDYRMTSRRLAPGASTDGVVVFERPAFKEARERLLLEVAQAEEVDRPVVAPIAFVGPSEGGTK